MPFDRSLYPPNWDGITIAVKERAHWLCEWPGCQAPHGLWIIRRRSQLEAWAKWSPPSEQSDAPMPDWHGPIKVVITSAHLCECNPICGNVDHIVALCQLHHLRLDGRQHALTAALNRRRQQFLAGQGFLFAELLELPPPPVEVVPPNPARRPWAASGALSTVRMEERASEPPESPEATQEV